MTTSTNPWPTIPDDEASPFHYASLSGCAALFTTHQHLTTEALPRSLAPAVLSGRTYLAVAYQRYHASYPTGDAVINELELSILAVPAERSLRVPIDVHDFLRGNDQAKQIGFFPLHVACDHDAAISPGIEIFGEPKFKARFDIETPSWNTHRQRGWSIAITDADGSDPILALSLPAIVGGDAAALSPITTYSLREGHLIGSRWQINNPTVASQSRDISRCRLKVHDTDHEMARRAAALISGAVPVAMWQHLTQPVATRFRPFYVDPVVMT
ncbi:hypothetical protein OG225_42625 (plasmid) [Nocardia sp. NBC_01377]|uniref:hypothetical protein n=1 Tax=Nocardia sp. NBC_01377 TaxID=2903595 RepID=UPI002F915EEE